MKGEYRHTLDTKGRVSVPSKLRDALGERFTVTKGLDHSIALYPENEWNELDRKIRALPMGKSRDLQRFFFSAAFDAELDSQGRILLPANLRAHGGLGKEVVIIGSGNHAEIWDAARWDAYNDSIDDARIESAMEELGF
ncbi:MAG: division/cell wall cluster transcriptional repressor MraZ [Butyricicoccus sp.]|nr:division/cell wall cluster transcriptional repressor MraZ [Butyricicoccus sp.]